MSREGIAIENVHDLSLIDPDTGEVVFSTSDPELALPEGVRQLYKCTHHNRFYSR